MQDSFIKLVFGGVIAPFVNPDNTRGYITSKQTLVLQFKVLGICI